MRQTTYPIIDICETKFPCFLLEIHGYTAQLILMKFGMEIVDDPRMAIFFKNLRPGDLNWL